MDRLSDEMLIETYFLSAKLKLSEEFLTLVLLEIHKRNLQPPVIT
ncbi:hypothetical protein J2S74_002681 [Evansella vedderi]|uniref:Sporulation histidine kinase inhibitor Sda n=1 Tax=Evansella vedderi TaxID=38282 RepID=A0ABT9ZVN2_9BACI|nr:sporulation histidine kinase inhibitor Sda [Evansella vedderi]MDQ0255299.1 hypothetical protein [Evansella vedderi]